MKRRFFYLFIFGLVFVTLICGCRSNGGGDTPNIPVITTIAGNEIMGYSGDNGSAVNAELNSPSGVAVDSDGNIYIADTDNNCIRKVDTNGIITTIAGNGTPGYSGDDGPAVDAELDHPSGVAVDSDGNIYIADTENNRIRKIDGITGIISTVAGEEAQLNSPYEVAFDTEDNIYIADTHNSRICKIDTNGAITTVAGKGTFDFGGFGGYSGDGGPAVEAELNWPHGVAVDSDGHIYIADSINNRIRKVDSKTGIISTIAGGEEIGYAGDGGPAAEARLWQPEGITVDTGGNICIADSFNNRIRNIDANGIITTVAGNGTAGYSGDDSPALNGQLFFPRGVAVDANGNIYIADTVNNCIRMVK